MGMSGALGGWRLIWHGKFLLRGVLALSLQVVVARGFHVCYAFFGPVSDLGWTYYHNLARASADVQLETTSQYEESVFFKTGEEQRQIMDGFTQGECDLIVMGSETMEGLAVEYSGKYPSKKFIVIAGTTERPNLAGVYGRLYQGFFIAGAVAAIQPGVRRIGYVGSYYTADSMRNINAAYLGASSVSPSLEFFVIHVGSWFAPREERIATLRLFYEYGVDLVMYDSDSTEVVSVARKEEKLSVAVKCDGTAQFGERNLLSVIYIWNDIFVDFISTAMNESTWTARKDVNNFVGFEKNAISLATYSSRVPATSRLLAKGLIQAFADGQDQVFCPAGGAFTGTFCPSDNSIVLASLGTSCSAIWPCKNVSNRTVSPGSSCLDDTQLRSMTWFLKGIQDIGLLQVSPSCEPGTYLNATALEVCKTCQPGSFTQAKDQPSCEPCPEGTASNVSNATRCGACLAGFFANKTGLSQCMACPAGSFSDGGAVYCTLCPPGTFRKATGGATVMSCEKCPLASFSADLGTTSCAACNLTFTTKSIASTSPEQCTCPSGTFKRLDSTHCTSCPEGMTCLEVGCDEANFPGSAGVAVRGPHPLLRPRHWSSSLDPLSIFACETESKCPGGLPETCGPGLVGPSCAFCETGSHWDGAKCRRCTDVERSKMLFPLILIVGCIIVVTGMYRLYKDEVEQWGSWQNGCMTLAFVLLNHYQTINLVGTTDLVLPSSLSSTLRFWSFSNDVSEIFRMDCAGLADFQSNVVLKSCMPSLVGVICILTFGGSKVVALVTGLSTAVMDFSRTFNVFMSLMYTFFNAITDVSCTLFKCFDNPNGLKTLASDFSVVCYTSDTWLSMLAIGISAFCIYCVAFVALLMRTVYIAPAHFQDRGFRMRWKFLLIKYRADIWFFGLFFLTKNLLINVGFVIFPYTLAQLYWVLTVVVLYTGLIVVLTPYRHTVANHVEIISGVSINYIVAIATWYCDRKGGRYDGNLAITAVIISFFPLLAGLVSMTLTFCVGTGKAHDIDRRNRLVIADLLHCANALHNAQHDEIFMNFKLMGEWDKLCIERFTTIIKAEMLGNPCKPRASVPRTLSEASSKSTGLGGSGEESKDSSLSRESKKRDTISEGQEIAKESHGSFKPVALRHMDSWSTEPTGPDHRTGNGDSQVMFPKVPNSGGATQRSSR